MAKLESNFHRQIIISNIGLSLYDVAQEVNVLIKLNVARHSCAAQMLANGFLDREIDQYNKLSNSIKIR